MYVVVYGPDWEDTAYFSDFDKAKRKLIIQSADKSMDPVLYVYTDQNGVYIRQKQFFVVDKHQLSLSKLYGWSMPTIIDKCVVLGS